MKPLRHIACGLTLAIACCGEPPKKNEKAKTAESTGISTVDEVYGLSQGLVTDGLHLTVRGWLVADEDRAGYLIYNAVWDSFEPESKKGIPWITLKFQGQPSDYWIGQYTNVAGIIATESLPDGSRAVTLDQAKVVSERIETLEAIPYRINQAQQVGAGQPATQSRQAKE